MKNIIFAVIIVCFAVACKKTEQFAPSRLFRPVISGQLVADSNTIVAAWQKIAGAKSYILQVSRDTFRTIDVTMNVDTNVVEIKRLLFNQTYQLQVQALAPDSAFNSRWSFLGSIKTLSSILKEPAIDDITFNSVRVRWTNKGAPVSSIKIIKTDDGTVAADVMLTPADITSEFKIVSGLQAETRYTIQLFSGSDMRGDVLFTTKAPFSGIVVDLTGITGRPSVLTDTLSLIPAGSTVLLKRGETYTVASTTNLSKSVIIMSGPDLSTPDPAKIFFTSNFNFVAGSTIDSIEFNGVHMYSDNYASRYVFNTTASANVGKIKFMNSRVEIFRGVCRLQSGTTTISNFIIDNSIVDSIAGYGVLTIGSASTKVENISITNSTIYKVEKFISASSSSTSVLVDACTFNEAPQGNNSYYIDYGTGNTVTNGITVTNCIFGVGKANPGTNSVRGYRASSATVMNSGNNYRTADYVSGGNDFPNITTSNRTSTLLWVDPKNGDFTIADNTFPGRVNAGDPRWR